jgi:hypothetical protein
MHDGFYITFRLLPLVVDVEKCDFIMHQVYCEANISPMDCRHLHPMQVMCYRGAEYLLTELSSPR